MLEWIRCDHPRLALQAQARVNELLPTPTQKTSNDDLQTNTILQLLACTQTQEYGPEHQGEESLATTSHVIMRKMQGQHTVSSMFGCIVIKKLTRQAGVVTVTRPGRHTT